MTLFRPAQDSEAGLGARHMLVAPIFPVLVDLPWCYEHSGWATEHSDGVLACPWATVPEYCRIGTVAVYPAHQPKAKGDET